MAVANGCYGGQYYQVGDVFDLVSWKDFADSTYNYAGPGAGVQQFGWMQQVPSSTPLLTAQQVQFPAPLFPVENHTPPIRYVY
jgi:hypothetical protein